MELVFTAGFQHTFSRKMLLIKYPISFIIWGSGLVGWNITIRIRRFSNQTPLGSQLGCFKLLFDSPQLALGHLPRSSITDPMVNAAFSKILTWSTPRALLQGSQWRSGQNRSNAVINIGLVRIVPSITAQSLLRGSQKAVKKIYQTYFSSQSFTDKEK